MKEITLILCILLAGCLSMEDLTRNPFIAGNETPSGGEQGPAPIEHYITQGWGESPGWYCENISYSRVKVEFSKTGTDYCRCLWTTVDNTEKTAVSAEMCAPPEWGCYNEGGTLTPSICWDFADCTINGTKMYRECSCGDTSHVIELPGGTHELCSWATVSAGYCNDCWKVEYSEAGESSCEHYIGMTRTDGAGWYCKNVSGGTHSITFSKKASDYCRCFWTGVDYSGDYVGAENCAPTELGCHVVGGTLTPSSCWDFASCAKDEGTLYRECACNGASYTITVPEGTHEVCTWVSVYSDCPALNCWTAEIN